MTDAEQMPLGAELSDDEQLQIGHAASAALPYMKYLFDTLTARYYQQWRRSSPEHRNEREELHDKQTVLDEMSNQIQADIRRGESIIARRQSETDPNAKEQRRLDTEGFGLDFDQRGAQ